MSTIESPGVIDWLAVSDDGSEVVLVVSDHLSWVDEAGHIVKLQEKLNVYLACIESGEAIELADAQLPGKRQPSARVRVEIVARHSLSAGGDAFLRYATKAFEAIGASLTHRVLLVLPSRGGRG